MFNNYLAIKEFLTSKIKTCRVLVVGDVMLEQNYFGEGNLISSDAPLLANSVLREKETLGGAANVAHNLALLGCKVFLAAAIGEDEKWVRLVYILNGLGISSEGLISIKKKPTNIKIQLIIAPEQFPELKFEKINPINITGDKKIRLYVEACIEAGADVIIISDYGKGVCTPALCQYIIKRGNEAKIPVLVDPYGINRQKYSRAFLITPNMKKMCKTFGISIADNDNLITALMGEINSEANLHLNELAAAYSEKGLSLVSQDAKNHVPPVTPEVFDVFGAGDTFIAVLGATLAGQINLPDAARLANLASSIVVSKNGAAAISREELLATFESGNS